MRRLTLLILGGAVWLFLAAIPVFADGGPHQAQFNNGSMGINADSCAACHRFHSSNSSVGAAGVFLGNNATTKSGTSYSDVTEFCVSCHSGAGMGATTDVVNGLQYYNSAGADATTQTNLQGPVLGALRDGGFVNAQIGTGIAYRLIQLSSTSHSPGSVSNGKVPPASSWALNGTNVTSAHLGIDGSSIVAANIVWGNGGTTGDKLGTYGVTLSSANGMECTTCHNPHGNGNYRILEPGPSLAGVGDTTTGVLVTDDTNHSGAGTQTRNYTIIQNGSLLTATDVVNVSGYSPQMGDYFHRYSPYNAVPGASNTPPFPYDAPNGTTYTYNGTTKAYTGFNSQIDAWCVQCHTQYLSNNRRIDRSTATGVPSNPYHFQHVDNGTTRVYLACTTCHVAHGTNARMDGTGGTNYSHDVLYPGGTVSRPGDSRLLKVDNRGTCELCHDPTNGSAPIAYYGSYSSALDAPPIAQQAGKTDVSTGTALIPLPYVP